MADAGNVPTWVLQRSIDYGPHCRRTCERMFPVLADGIDMAQVHEDTVVDGLRAGIRIDGFAEHVFVAHDLVPFGPRDVCHG